MKQQFSKQIAIASKTKNVDVQLKSQSGGMFSVISDSILETDGIVYGCEMLEDFTAAHKRATTKNERNKMQGSKYVQSNLGTTFINIKKDLNDNKKVLFVGTPCQVAGLKLFLNGTNIDNLTLIDIVCHGVPSPGVWKDFLNFLKKKHKNISNVIFRNKKYGWESSVCTFNVNGTELRNNTYNTLFYKHYITRPSCYKCKYKNLTRAGDITIGDCWGIKNKNFNFYDKNGVSLLLINNQHGLDLFNEIKNNIIYKEINIDDYLQPALNKNYNIPKKREKFWIDYKEKDFKYISKKYGGNNLYTKFKRTIKKILKRK